MGASRYGISLRVFNRVRCRVKHSNTIVEHLNTIALYWQEKPTSLMNENKRIDNPQSWSALALTLKMEKCVESWLQKQQ